MKNDPPNKAEREWREAVRGQGCILDYPGPVEIHHVVGRTAKHNKVDIGHWFILPVSSEAHREVERMSKREQADWWLDVCVAHLKRFGSLPFSGDVAIAIWGYHR